MSVRPAEEADLPTIAEIYNALLDTTTHEWTKTRHTAEERRGGSPRNAPPTCPSWWPLARTMPVIGWATYGEFRDSERWPGYTIEHLIHVAESHWGEPVGTS